MFHPFFFSLFLLQFVSCILVIDCTLLVTLRTCQFFFLFEIELTVIKFFGFYFILVSCYTLLYFWDRIFALILVILYLHTQKKMILTMLHVYNHFSWRYLFWQKYAGIASKLIVVCLKFYINKINCKIGK